MAVAGKMKIRTLPESANITVSNMMRHVNSNVSTSAKVHVSTYAITPTTARSTVTSAVSTTESAMTCAASTTECALLDVEDSPN